MSQQQMAYMATKPCGCAVMISMDLPDEETRRDNAREIASCVRKGYTVSRVTPEIARQAFTRVCPICRPAVAEPQLFAEGNPHVR